MSFPLRRSFPVLLAAMLLGACAAPMEAAAPVEGAAAADPGPVAAVRVAFDRDGVTGARAATQLSRAAWLPSLNANSYYANSSNERFDANSGRLSSESYNAGLQVGYDLFTGGRRFAQQRSARAEYGAASAVARWTDQGKEVTYCLLSSGEAGIDSMAPDECARIREEEERRSAAVVGVHTVEFLGHPDGLIEADVALRRDIAAAIRRHRPEVVVSINFRETFGMPGFNHADHRATGIALIDAVRDAANRWLFVGAGGEPVWGKILVLE